MNFPLLILLASSFALSIRADLSDKWDENVRPKLVVDYLQEDETTFHSKDTTFNEHIVKLIYDHLTTASSREGSIGFNHS